MKRRSKIKIMKKRLCVIVLYGILLCGIATAAFSTDFGLILGTEGEYADNLNPEDFSVTTTVLPWVSAVFTDTTNLYVSGKMTFAYEEHREPPGSYVFEVERTELSLRPASGLYLGLGRQRFEDAAGMAASGLFDGAAFNVKLGMSRLSLGLYYTGLLYKETAQILLTSGDRERYQKPLDSSGFEGYFASRRVLMALAVDFPDLTSRTSLTAQALAQVDVNDDAEKLHTQYLELRFAADPLDPLHLTLGGIGELLQGPDELRGSMAAFTGVDWELPGTVPDLLSAEALWTSGRSGEQTSAFTPVSGRNAGRIFDGGTGALAKAALSYRLRPLNSVSLEAGGAYFIRTDLETLRDSELDGDSDSRLVGGEVYGSLLWAPDPAFRFSTGGGAFFPKWGEAYREDAPVKWKVNLGMTLSL